MTSFTVLVAATEPHSAIRAAAVRAAETVVAHTGITTDTGAPVTPNVIDLAELGPALLTAGTRDVDAAVDQVTAGEYLLVATPQIHGGYSGLLKVFLDRLPELSLAHTLALPMAVVEDLRNGRNVDDDLRVVLSELGAWVAEPGLLLTHGELAEPHGVIAAWSAVAAPALRQGASIAA